MSQFAKSKRRIANSFGYWGDVGNYKTLLDKIPFPYILNQRSIQ